MLTRRVCSIQRVCRASTHKNYKHSRDNSAKEMNSLESAHGYFYQFIYSQDNMELLKTCIMYFDKLIEIWARSGFALVSDSANSGVHNIQSDVYIHQCQKQTVVLQYSPKIGAIIKTGTYKNRTIEVMGIYTNLSKDDRKGYKYEPVVACFFQDGQENKEFYTFQTARERDKNIDNRAYVVKLIGSILHNTENYIPLFRLNKLSLFKQPEGVYAIENPNWLKLFERVLQPRTERETFIIRRFSQIQPIFLTPGMVSHFMQKVVSQKNARPFLEYIIQNIAILTQRYIKNLKPPNAKKDAVRLRLLKHIYTRLYGYDPKIQDMQTMEEFGVYVDPNIRDVVENQAELIVKGREQAAKCIHNQSRDLFQFIAPHEEGSDIVLGDKTVRVKIGMLQCIKCEQPLVCAHRVVEKAMLQYQESDPLYEQLSEMLERFAVETIGNNIQTICAICGVVLYLKRDTAIATNLMVTAEDIKQLAQSKGYTNCQRVTMTALKYMQTDAKYYTMNFVMDIYTNLYPAVKVLVKDFKPDHDYKIRKLHALIIAVAAYFSNVQQATTGKTTLIFDLVGYYKFFVSKRELTITLTDFNLQVDALKSKKLATSQVILREPAIDYHFFRIINKPYLFKFIQAAKLQSIQQIEQFILNHSLSSKMRAKTGVIDVNDLYTILLFEVLRERKINVPLQSSDPGRELRAFVYKKSANELKDLEMFEFVQYLNAIEPIQISSDFQWTHNRTNASIAYAKTRGCSAIDTQGIVQRAVYNHDVPIAQKYTPQIMLREDAESVKQQMIMFYQRYCVKNDLKPHEIEKGKCVKCEFSRGSEPQLPQESVYVRDYLKALVQKDPAYVFRQMIDKEIKDRVIKATADYKETPIQRIAQEMGLKGIQLTNLGGFDYIGYKETLSTPDITPIRILRFNAQQHLGVYRKPIEVEPKIPVSADLKYTHDVKIDWGVYRNRLGRIQNHIRSFILKCGQQNIQLLQHVHKIQQSMLQLHKNAYIHCQVFIYYFITEILPVLQKTTNPQMITRFFQEMAAADEAISSQINKEAKFGLHVVGDREMRLFNDDEIDENAEVLAEDEVSDVLP